MFDAIWSSPGASLCKFCMGAFGADSLKPSHLAGNAPWLQKLEAQDPLVNTFCIDIDAAAARPAH